MVGLGQKIWLTSGEWLQSHENGRIHVSEGTVLVQDLVYYEKRSYIPKQIWRTPTIHELDQWIVNFSEEKVGQQIAIIKVPDEIMGKFQTIRQVKTINELEALEASNHLKKAKESLISFLEPISDAPINYLGIGMNSPGLTTVTNEGKYIGLHIDSCDRESIWQRGESKNRFMLNCGSQARSFLFVNLSLAGILDRLKTIGYGIAQLEAIGVTKVSKLFMDSFSDYPVIKLNLYPGEAYIAPTENIIHDGSTIDMTESDIFVTTRSRFRLNAL